MDQLTVPVQHPSSPEWGSDVAAEMLRMLGVEHIALNPGASYRGFHDSLVNYNGNSNPSIILCNHEEVAVAIAHGYFKASGKLMAAALHSNVGLMHGSMGIFDAWCDRVPVLIFGGTGPMDSTRRRPWIDWIHTANGQGDLVRDFTKWEHQPASVEAIPEAILRGWRVALTEPYGPVYICLDAGLQEQKLDPSRPFNLPDLSRYPLSAPIEPSPGDVREAARLLCGAKSPVILLGRGTPTQRGWDDLVALAELLGAAVLPDNKSPAAFPTNHYLFQSGAGIRAGNDFEELLGQSDVVLSLDRIDPAGTMRAARGASADFRHGSAAGGSEHRAKLINVSLDEFAVRSWTTDFQELPAADLPILANVERFAALLMEEVRRALRDDASAQARVESRAAALRSRRLKMDAGWRAMNESRWDEQPISMGRVGSELRDALGESYENTIVTRLPHASMHGAWDFTRPGAHIGNDGGGGVGSGPGMSVGAALAARGSGRPVVAFLGDGDLLMAPTALWTAAHHRIPLLVIVANNHSYYNDEEHQNTVARTRGRPPENKWIGQRIDSPAVNFAGLARDLGVEGFGPVQEPGKLKETFAAAVRAVQSGNPALVDVHIAPR